MKTALSFLLLVSGAALADDAAVLKCRTLADAASRLACYDAMPVAAAGTPAARVEAPVQPEARFGLAAPPKPAKDKGPKTIRSNVAGAFEGWSPGTRIELANGQVWRVTEGEAVLPQMNNPQVEISRGALGGYLMQVGGYASTARVARIR